MTDPDLTRAAVAVRGHLHALVADVEPAPDAFARILAGLPDSRPDAGRPGSRPDAGSPDVSRPGPATPLFVTPLPSVAPHRSRRVPVAVVAAIAAALVLGVGWAVVAGHDAGPGTIGPAGTAASSPGTGGTSPAGPAGPESVSASGSTSGSATGAAAAADRQHVQAASAACVAEGVTRIDEDGPPVAGGTVATGPATGWTATAHLDGHGFDGDLTFGTAPGGHLAACLGGSFQYLGVLAGPPGEFPTVAAPATGRAQQLVADATAAAVGVNLQAGVLAPDVARVTVTSGAGVATEVDVVDHTYALRIGPVPGTTTAADATMHLYDAAGTQTWSGPVE